MYFVRLALYPSNSRRLAPLLNPSLRFNMITPQVMPLNERTTQQRQRRNPSVESPHTTRKHL